jgi:hypothetical protein
MPPKRIRVAHDGSKDAADTGAERIVFAVRRK